MLVETVARKGGPRVWVSYVTGQVLKYVPNLFRQIPLELTNRTGRRRIPRIDDTTGPVVSLTTHGDRMEGVHLTVESILRGTEQLPVLLWLDKKDFDKPWPASLRRLVDRGLDVRCSNGAYGPHTKYLGTFRQLAGTGRQVITIDDDIIYPVWFLERLIAAEDGTNHVVGYRCHRIVMENGRMLPYKKWVPVRTMEPSIRNFATGVSGVIYPPSMVDYVTEQGDAFMECTPRADDVWLHACAIRSGHLVRQVTSRSRGFALIPFSQRNSLVSDNLGGGGNDSQISEVYTEADIEKLAKAR